LSGWTTSAYVSRYGSKKNGTWWFRIGREEDCVESSCCESKSSVSLSARLAEEKARQAKSVPHPQKDRTEFSGASTTWGVRQGTSLSMCTVC